MLMRGELLIAFTYITPFKIRPLFGTDSLEMDEL